MTAPRPTVRAKILSTMFTQKTPTGKSARQSLRTPSSVISNEVAPLRRVSKSNEFKAGKTKGKFNG